MKYCLLALLFAVQAAASDDDVFAACFAKAANAVENHREAGYYDQGGVTTWSCADAPNGKTSFCIVSALKGGGAAVDIYRVVLDPSCAEVFGVELTSQK